MNNIKIVEYNDKYASSLAHMWNESSENWGGDDTLKTEQDVKEEIKNSGDLSVFLALDEENVVGYCSFSEYRMDDGASYIPLLNVRPDYHGKKVGKLLVLKAVDRAINSDWPRLDLFTWPGNVKAVPLYKKCGFFWENRDDTTHLMNFIPNVLKTEAVKEYFNDLDWYKDCKRDIEVKPDGKEENGFDYYEYIWEKDNTFLRMEYERKGRGLRLIETNEYLIKAYAEKHELVFGKKYKVYYEIINKSDKDLNISIKGLDDKNIKFNFEKEIKVVDREIIEGEFFVNEIEEEQNLWRTHPIVNSIVNINGKKSTFKVGITPKFPIKIELKPKENESYINASSKLYLDLENNFDENINIKFKLIDNEIIKFSKNEIDIKLSSKEKISLELDYILKKYGFYNEDIKINISTSSDEIEFNRKLTAPFRGLCGKYYGEDEKNWMIFNGKYMVKLDKLENDIYVENNKESDFQTIVMFPKLGLPYSLEFSKKRVDNIKYQIEDDYILMKAEYNSRDFKEISILSFIKLYNNGLTENYYEVHNKSNVDSKNLYISYSVYHQLENFYMPYEDKIVKTNGNDGGSYSYWDYKKVSENWILCDGDSVKRGIVWSDDLELRFNNWYMAMNKNIGVIKPNECIKVSPIYISWDVFKDYKELRNFAMKSSELSDLKIVNDIDIKINDGNPFVKDNIKIDIKDYKKSDMEGKIKVKSKYDTFNEIKKNMDSNNEVFRINADKLNEIDIIKIKADLKGKKLKEQHMIFKIDNNDIKYENKIEKEKEVLEADNGVLKIKASPDFSSCLYSIVYNDNEWLDSSFPTPKPNAWWNPWSGGIYTIPEKFSNVSLYNEKISGEFVNLKDNYNNNWQGIKTTLDIIKNEKFKGIKINQYYLMLSGLPVLLITSEIEQNTGKFMSNEKFMRNTFVKSSDDQANSFFKLNYDNNIVKYKSAVETELSSLDPFIYGGEDRKDNMIVFSTEGLTNGYINSKASWNFKSINLTIPNGSKVFTQNEFIIFNKKDIDKDLLNSFKNIKFK